MRARALLLLAVPLLGAGVWMARARPRPPLKTAYWYWHHPFELDQTGLDALEVSRLYVHAGTLTRGPTGLRLTSRQEWRAAPHVELAGVVRVDAAVNDAVMSASEEDLRRLIGELRLPEGVRTLQWDLDAPTKALPRFAAFLRRSRAAAPAGFRIGATALPDWIGAPGYDQVCAALDEISPQFYGNQIPRDGEAPPPLWETRNLAERAARSAAGPAEVWLGLPAYGRCVVMDPARRFAGLRHDVNPDDLLEDPTWELVSASTRREGPASVEEVVDFRSPDGARFWFQWPRADGLRAWVAANQAALPERVTGICYFRWPASSEPLRVPLHSQTPETTLEALAQGPEVAIRVRTGSDTPPAGSEMELTVRPGGGEVVTRHPYHWLRNGERVSRLRGEEVRLTLPYLRPDSRWDALRIAGARETVRATLRWQGGDGSWQERTASADPRRSTREP